MFLTRFRSMDIKRASLIPVRCVHDGIAGGIFVPIRWNIWARAKRPRRDYTSYI